MLNTAFNRMRRRTGFSCWSLSAYLKLRVKNAVNYIGAFEEVRPVRLSASAQTAWSASTSTMLGSPILTASAT